MGVGSRVLAARRKRGWTQDRLASEAGVHKNTICHIEKTGAARVSTICDLARALGINPASLLRDGHPGRGAA